MAGNTPTLVTNLCRAIKDREICFSPIQIRRSKSFLCQLSDCHKDSFIRQLLLLNISNWIELRRTYDVTIRCWSVVTHGGTQYTYVVGRPGVVLKSRVYTWLGLKGLMLILATCWTTFVFMYVLSQKWLFVNLSCHYAMMSYDTCYMSNA